MYKPIKLYNMAGGKESPRQKMIGMMYLVLTALLALNVSKSILDAFVAIEENTQKSNIIQFERGNGFIQNVKTELETTSNSPENFLKKEKLKFVFQKMKEIDELSSTMIISIDNLKEELLKESGENIDLVDFLNDEAILWTDMDELKKALPIRMNLMAVEAKDQYDTPMQLLIGDDIKKPNSKGLKLWGDFQEFRSALVNTCGTYEINNQSFKVSLTAINSYSSNDDLVKRVEKMIDDSPNLNKEDDRQFLIDLYLGLTKKEKNRVHDVDEVHWIGQTFDHAPLVAALASLSSLQQDILSARALALSHWESKVSTGEFNFNRILPLVYGPSVVNRGDSISLELMMGAFNSEDQPRVTVGGVEGASIQYPKNGKGVISFKSGQSSVSLNGTIAIKNKNGIWKEKKWSHEVVVMKPTGSIELPKMNVLYRGYKNLVNATASGYDQTILSGTDVSIVKNGEGYIVKPTGRSREAYLVVKGKNNISGETKELRRVKYRVSNMPKAELYWGSVPDGGRGSKHETRIFAKYPPSIPLDAQFEIISWECNVQGAPGAPPTGSGNNLSNRAMSLISQARTGSTITISVKYKMRGGSTTIRRSATYKV